METIKEFWKKNHRSIILGSCLFVLILLIIVVKTNAVEAFDKACYEAISSHISEGNTKLVKCITNFANAYFLIGLSLILLLCIKDKMIGMSIFTNLALSFFTNFILKLIMHRPRPMEYQLVEEGGYSFPSGHSMVSMAFYGFLIYLIFKNVQNKHVKRVSIALLSILILCIGTTRVYLGVHYASDVLAGFMLGIAYLVVFTWGWKKALK